MIEYVTISGYLLTTFVVVMIRLAVGYYRKDYRNAAEALTNLGLWTLAWPVILLIYLIIGIGKVLPHLWEFLLIFTILD